MKKIFTLISVALLTTLSANAQTETYTACSESGLSAEFAAVVDESGKATNAANGQSVVTFGTTNVEVTAVGGTTPANKETGQGDDITADGVVGSWKDITWQSKNQGDISFYYLLGTGNPYVKLKSEAVVTDDEIVGYRAAYDYYEADGSNGMPITGLYYKFTPKVAGSFKIGIWANKGNRKTFIVDESTMKAIEFNAEGYVNGQNESYIDADGNTASRKRYLTAEQIDSIHNTAMNAEITKIDTTVTDETEKATKIEAVKAKYANVIGQGNQASWLYLTFNAEAGKSYWLFQHSSQVGFQGYEFTPSDDTGVTLVTKEEDVNAPIYNLAGQRVDANYRGVVIQNGKKFRKQ